MAGFYKFELADALGMASMIAAMPPRSRSVRTRLALACMAHGIVPRDGSRRYFSVGGRTLAAECGVTHKAARGFLGWAEAEGWLDTIGTAKAHGGEFTRRSFAWWCAPERAHPVPVDPPERAHPCAPTPAPKGTHQISQISDGVMRHSDSCESGASRQEAPVCASPMSDEDMREMVLAVMKEMGGGADG